MFQFAVFFALAALVNSQGVLLEARDNDQSSPTPYQFSYSAPAIGGGSTHEETGDEYGRKTGSYTVQNEDGSQRIVQYVADEDGFRASISTNEPGTSNQNPADVTIQSSADEGSQYPSSAAAPAAPVRRIPTVRQPFNSRRVISRPGQPFVVPFQPTVIPIQPTVVPVSDSRYFQLGGARLIPQAFPFAGNQPLLFPLETSVIPVSDGYYQPNIILQPY